MSFATRLQHTDATAFDRLGVDMLLDGVPVRGVFDAAYAPGSVGAYGMAASQPAMSLPTASVPANPVGLPVVVYGTAYLVAAHEPDGTGISRLLLEKA